MKVAALALVLIIASAVVLIFANTLNSWVLGGLIGGLAAILITIPISLIIFTSLARRHDERLYAQMTLEQEADQTYYQDEYQQGYAEGDGYDEYDEYGGFYEAEAYYLPDEDEYELPRGRRQPEVRSLPAAGQSYASSAAQTTANQRVLNNTHNAASAQAFRKPTRDLGAGRQRTQEISTRHNAQTGHQRNPRSPYTTRSLRSHQQAAALRAAQQEAAQGVHAPEQVTTGPMRRHSTTRHLPPQSIQLHRSRLQEEAAKNSAVDAQRGRYPTTEPIRMNPDTGQITRNPQLGEVFRGDEAITGNLHNPLVRRAPYLYEDDAMREEFSQQINKPIARRASLYQSLEEEE
ncbi:MAG TPA: hypothetical protein VKR83_14110 [Ktedonobacteraceae bacterium]|nr:hypothetical protein [Ktedonobacteraceae bacterium]